MDLLVNKESKVPWDQLEGRALPGDQAPWVNQGNKVNPASLAAQAHQVCRV